jgi:hypothetical protein
VRTEIATFDGYVAGRDLLERAERAVGLWHADADRLVGGDAEALCAAAEAMIASGEAKRLCELIETQAADHSVIDAVAELIGSFIPPKDVNIRIFSRMMAHDVLALGASAQAIEVAAAKLRAGCDFLPSIKKVVDAVKEQDEGLKARAELIRRLPGRIKERRGLTTGVATPPLLASGEPA